MKTAVDTNVLLDVLVGLEPQASASASALREARARGGLVLSEPVFAELAAAFDGDAQRLDAFLAAVGAVLVRNDAEVLVEAGRRWRARPRVDGARRRILPDYWIGAHALHHADALMTRGRGFARAGVAGLEVWDPTVG
ncbi:MAG: type II toxin-antitoxin system VapC family toxin [Myxococcota bacterium]